MNVWKIVLRCSDGVWIAATSDLSGSRASRGPRLENRLDEGGQIIMNPIHHYSVKLTCPILRDPFWVPGSGSQCPIMLDNYVTVILRLLYFALILVIKKKFSWKGFIYDIMKASNASMLKRPHDLRVQIIEEETIGSCNQLDRCVWNWPYGLRHSKLPQNVSLFFKHLLVAATVNCFDKKFQKDYIWPT